MQVGDGGSGQIAVLNEWRWQDNERGGWGGTRRGTEMEREKGGSRGRELMGG